jgi:beta-lactamase regulating signal transducer with metallopeptidase domain
MEYLQYILISTACISISYITYRLFLRKDTHFRYLRLFLTGTLLLSLLLPLFSVRIDCTTLFRKETNLTHSAIQVFQTGNIVPYADAPKEGFFSSHASLFINIYLIIAALLIVRIMIQLLKLLRLYAVSGKRKSGENIILTSSHVKSPFSFFHLIFIPVDMSDNEETEGIITHESIHASQYHSFDNLLFELISAVMWFNPLVWRMKNSLHLVHEYLADEGALDTGIDRLRYQTLLLNHVSEESLVCFSSGLNHSLIKKRMIMMTKSKNNRGKKLTILTLLPLSAILLLAVALLNGFFPQQAKAENPGSGTMSPLNIVTSPDTITIISNDTCKKKVILVKSGCEKKCEKKTVMIKSTGAKKCKEGDSLTYVIELKEGSEIKELNPDQIESMTVNDNDTTIIVKSKSCGKGQPNKIIIKTDKGEISDNTLILVDGKKVTKEDMDKIDPETIKTINVFKDETKNEGYDGVIKITTKESDSKVNEEITKNTLIYLNGKQITKEEMDKIDNNTIETINIIKGKEALKTAGYDKKYDGVVNITTKAKE